MQPPTGLVTLLFTDIERSSDLWQEHGAAFQPVLDRHNALLRAAAQAAGGFEVKTVGDAFFLAFPEAGKAVRFALEAQLALQECDWSQILPALPELRVRIGIHAGEPILARHPDGKVDYFGPPVNRTARIEAAGHGGQVIVSGLVRELAAGSLPEGASFIDQGVHRLKGVGEEHLWQLAHPRLRSEFPPLSTLDPQRHNLPRPDGPYIGREGDLEGWLELVRNPATRLVSLIGFGGMGKTRTALHLAELLLDDFPQGVWWVELEEARDPEGALQRIALAFRLPPQASTPVRDQVFGYLRERKLLLVLDNGEQVEGLPRLVADLLAAAPGVTVLATSRKPLELRNERRVELRPLAQAEAVELFADSARSRRDDWELTPENREDVAELCRQLEGVPLAIELAASRVVGMTPREMLSRLDQQFRLLQSRSPDLPPRQRALRGAIDWSYDLLAEEDREAFAQLGVFAGSFEMEAAEAVCDCFDPFESVLELRKHSLLQAETDPETQQTRFRMLRTVRSYARERLKDLPGGGAQFLDAHARYYLQFAEERVRRLSGRAGPAALAGLRRELENLRAALDWRKEVGPRELCCRLAAALYVPFYRLGLWSDARHVLETGLSEAEDEVPLPVRADLETAYASILDDTGRTGEALGHAQRALELRRRNGEAGPLADTLNVLGLVFQHEGRLDEAEAHFREALAALPESDAPRRGKLLHNLAYLASARGEWREAERGFQEALEERRRSSEPRAEAETRAMLGAVNQGLAAEAPPEERSRRLAAARALHEETLAFFREAGDRFWEGVALYNLGEVTYDTDRPEDAVGLFRRADALFSELSAAPAAATREWLERLRAELGPERFENASKNP